MDMLFELSLICLWIFSRSFINKAAVNPKEQQATDTNNKNEQYKDWF
jgi:hypothetical protein